MLSLSYDPQLPHFSALPRDQQEGQSTPDFLQCSFIGPLLGSLLRDSLAAYFWGRSGISPRPYGLLSPWSPHHKLRKSISGGHPHTPAQNNTKPMPNQAPSETNSFLDGNQAKINSPCSVPNHNLLERLLETSLSHGYPSYMAPFIRQSTSLSHPQSLKSVHILIFQLQICFKLQWLFQGILWVPFPSVQSHSSPPPPPQQRRVILTLSQLRIFYRIITFVQKSAHTIMAQLNKWSHYD